MTKIDFLNKTITEIKSLSQKDWENIAKNKGLKINSKLILVQTADLKEDLINKQIFQKDNLEVEKMQEVTTQIPGIGVATTSEESKIKENIISSLLDRNQRLNSIFENSDINTNVSMENVTRMAFTLSFPDKQDLDPRATDGSLKGPKGAQSKTVTINEDNENLINYFNNENTYLRSFVENYLEMPISKTISKRIISQNLNAIRNDKKDMGEKIQSFKNTYANPNPIKPIF